MKDMMALGGIGYLPNRPAVADSDGLGEVIRGQSGACKSLSGVSIPTVAIVGITLHLLLRYVFHTGTFTFSVPLYAVLLGGLPLVAELMRKLAKREFGSDLLAGISIVTSVIEVEYVVGAIVVLVLSGGTTLEAYA